MITLKTVLNTTLAMSAVLCGGACHAQNDHGIRRSGVHLSHGYPIPYNSYSFPRPYVGVPPYQIGTNSTGYGSGYTYGNRLRYGGSNVYQSRSYNYVAPGRYWYLPNRSVRY